MIKIQGTEGGVEEADGESASDADGSVKDRPGTVKLECLKYTLPQCKRAA